MAGLGLGTVICGGAILCRMFIGQSYGNKTLLLIVSVNTYNSYYRLLSCGVYSHRPIQGSLNENIIII